MKDAHSSAIQGVFRLLSIPVPNLNLNPIPNRNLSLSVTLSVNLSYGDPWLWRAVPFVASLGRVIQPEERPERIT